MKKKIFAVIVAMIIIGSCSSTASNSSSKDKHVTGAGTESQNAVVSTNEFTANLEVFNAGEYLFITPDNLRTYAANLAGQKVYTVVDVDDIKEDRIQSTLGDGFMMSSFKTSTNYSKSLSKGDLVAVFGEVEEITSYSFMGASVSLKDCEVFAKADDAQKFSKESSDDELSSFLVMSEDVANSMGSSKIGEDDYKRLCQSLPYEDILRNPDNYKDKYVVVSGKVDQVIEGLFKTFTFYLVDSSGNKWECSYMYKDGESHILQNDRVTFYGKCKGTTTSTTVLGKQVTMPYISLEYIH